MRSTLRRPVARPTSLCPVRFGGLLLLAAVALMAAAPDSLSAAEPGTQSGRIYLVGIGPGDPDLVTLKAARILKDADLVFCFAWLKPEVAHFVDEARIEVASPLLMGRFCGRDPKDFEGRMRERVLESASFLPKFAARVRQLVGDGKTVVFAASGDVSIYCPWSWVSEEFADVRPRVVPGISSLSAASAALGQSLTRGASSVTLSAGGDLGTPDEDGRLDTTLVFFTHKQGVEDLVPRLLARYPADTPVALVANASHDDQEIIRSTLGNVLKIFEKRPVPRLYLFFAGDGLSASFKAPEFQRRVDDARAAPAR